MTNPDDILELIFTHVGSAELRAFKDPDEEGDGTLVWASDTDLDFKDQQNNELLNADQDAEMILNYLVEKGALDEDEAPYVDIIEESLDGSDVAALEDEPGDDDEGDEDDDEG
jgi:hypothetical protein